MYYGNYTHHDIVVTSVQDTHHYLAPEVTCTVTSQSIKDKHIILNLSCDKEIVFLSLESTCTAKYHVIVFSTV